jgi:nucleoside-diphosphate-sugar epimerase
VRVLVTGAGGRIGRPVTARLSKAGLQVRALVLSRDASPLPGVSEVVIGDATDPLTVSGAVQGVDALVHLAANPGPVAEAQDVFTNNVTATFVLLEMAARAGVRRAIIASSMAALGLSWASGFRSPDYVPVDEDHPLRPEESYGLSKQVDEATGEMMARRYAMTVLAYRFCYTTSVDEIAVRAVKIVSDPEESTRSAKELWAYLDVRDAADAVLAGLERELSGFHAINIAAPQTLAAAPTAELMRLWHPTTEVRGILVDRQSPYATDRAAELLGFSAKHFVQPMLTESEPP